jgi:hypothetical protein
MYRRVAVTFLQCDISIHERFQVLLCVSGMVSLVVRMDMDVIE